MALDFMPSGLRPLLLAFLALIGSSLMLFLFNGYKARRRFFEMQKQGLPMPPHNPIFGHLTLVGATLAPLPSDAHRHYIADGIRRAYPDLGPTYYIDTWPFGPPMLVLQEPSALYQATQEHSLRKYSLLENYIRPLTGGGDLLIMEGKEWKTWRAIFNPGFSQSHLMTLVPGILEDTLTFCEILREQVQKGSICKLEDSTIKLTMDVIGRVTLGAKLNCQRERNELEVAFRSQARWLAFGDEPFLFDRFNPLRPIIRWRNTRIMNKILSRELDERFAIHQNTEEKSGKRSKSVVDLALDTYHRMETPNSSSQGMDATFKDVTIRQLKIFLFAGHDTTSSAILYAYHMLSTNPKALSQLISEHDSVFGTDIHETADLVASSPRILNRLPYTVAVIKETLRLFPPASSTRAGEPNFFLSSGGRQYPTEGCLVWSIHQALHRDPLYWPDADSFIPERWLVSAEDPLYPVKGAWRPFEMGPRNCIGQELGMLEVTLVLVMTVREFDVSSAFEELDKINPPSRPTTVFGERVYQIMQGGAHPCGGFPCRVRSRK
ncbi:hypothetical protein MMC09_003269 [Bachmanniomyces sp. S44760]|nr:hypothetical protein [Bachmanniomyces sp. S44760]